jgi:hypothetical protein
MKTAEIAFRAPLSARTLPRVATLESNDDRQLAAELRLARLRTQVAVVRALADQIELLVQPHHVDATFARNPERGLGEQLGDEMAQLGCRLFEVAAELTKSPASEDSGVFERPPATRVMQLPPSCSSRDREVR